MRFARQVAVPWPLVACLAACSGGGRATVRDAERDLAERFPLARVDDRALCDHLLARRAEDYATTVDPEPKLRRKVIVSDLHLGPGTVDPRFTGIEDFYADAEWSAFLAREGTLGPTDLVINGDFIEFWQIATVLGALPKMDDRRQPDGPVLGGDQAFAVTAIELVIAAHPSVFRAMGKFLDSGDHRIVVIAGNHDADLLWPKVQLAIARAVDARDPSRLLFVHGNAYQHGGTYVAHGHEFDAANRFATQHAPFGRDRDGRCRLQTNWGEVFVDYFYTETERQVPFIDNLYPEKTAVLWGIKDNPDLARDLGAAVRAVDLLRAAQGKGLNRDAAGHILQGAFGMPGKKRGPESAGEVVDHVADRLSRGEPGAIPLVEGLAELAFDPELAQLRSGLVAAVGALPDWSAALAALGTIEPAQLQKFQSKLFGDSMDTAAQQVIAERGVANVVMGHTHSVGGFVKQVRGGHYANTGSWIAVASVAELRAKGITFANLSLADRATFPSKMTAIIVEHRDGKPLPPVVQNR